VFVLLIEIMDRESFFCPITQEVMQDPVVDPEGNSYERSAIEDWLSKNNTSPLTRAPLTKSQLAPNRALREIIQEEIRKSVQNGDSQWAKPKSSNPAPVPAPQPPVAQEPVAPAPEASSSSPSPQVAAGNLDPAALAAAQAKAEAVGLKVTTARISQQDVLVHASIAPGPGITRSPADVCCVVDISGSMGSEASVKTGTGQEERHGLSLLDIVKHAVKTVIHSLQPQDRFALVVFSTTARVVSPLGYLTNTLKDQIFAKIDNLEPEDTTNLWDGMVKGLDMLQTATPGRVSTLLLLTDGLPNVTPPRGELAMLKKYKDSRKQLNTTINTFGFGYAIDTTLLVNLAIEGHGMHSFIPDASFVGTAFVNSISNVLVTMGTKVILSVEPHQGAKIDKVLGGFQYQLTSLGAHVNLCSLQYEQTKDVVLKLKVPANANPQDKIVTATLRYEPVKTAAEVKIEATSQIEEIPDVDLTVHQLRLDFVSAIAYVIELVQSNKDKEANIALADIQERVRQCDDPRTKALYQDISGQVKEAIIKAPENYFQKWGRHYLPSLARAHLLQQCNNFKDPGIQVYGGQLFQQNRDAIDDIFLQLPPPKPSVRRSAPSSSYSSSSSGGRGSYHYSAPQSMRVYHNAAGPCFAGDCYVLMANGAKKLIRDIAKGDMVQSVNGPAEVLCVIKTHCMKAGKAGIEDLIVFPSGLKITPFHPVRVDGKWSFPGDLHPWQLDTPCDAVFNFVLSQGHVMMIEGVECVTLGHGFTEPVVSHKYFGTERVVSDLQRMPGWNKGLVELFPALCQDGKCMVRDKDGLVCGFAPLVARDV